MKFVDGGSATEYQSNVMSDATIVKMKALMDLETNMDRLEKIII